MLFVKFFGSGVVMSQHVHTVHEKSSHSRDDFLARFMKNLAKEIAASVKVLRTTCGIIFAIMLGVFLFIAEFGLTQKIFAFAFLPVVVFIMGTYLTLLPMYIVIAVTCITLYSLANSDEGTSLVSFVDNLFGSVFEIAGPSSETTPLHKKLFGFMVISAVASFFIIFLV